MKTRLLATIIAIAMLAGLLLGAAPATAAPSGVAVDVTGTCENVATGAEGIFTGTLSLTRFTREGGNIVARGTLSGTCSAGGPAVNRQVTIPVDILQATCEVLRLELGPLHLELLGLIIDLNRVVLVITADPSGGILGELLCSLAGGGPLQQIVNLLNQILAILRGL